MRQVNHAVAIFIMSAAAILFAGCQDTYANKKQAMQTHWEKSAAAAQIPVIEDLIERSEIDEAKKMLEKCLREDPQVPGLYLIAGRINFIEGRTEQSRLNFEKAVEIDPTLAEGWDLLGSLAVMDKDYVLAMTQYNKALELQPNNPEYRVNIAELLIKQERTQEAMEMLQKGLELQPRNLDLLLTLAQLHQQMGNIEQAIEIYEQAQLMHGNDPRILESSGYAYVSLHKWSKAAEKFEQLLARSDSKTDHYNVVLRSLAMCSFNAENYDKALSCYDQLSVINRNDPEIWIGMAQSALGLDDADRAASCADRALQFKPGWHKAYVILGSALYMKADYERSLETFDELTADDEYAVFAWFMTGRCCRQLGQTVQADDAFKRAEQLDPNNELVTTFLKKTLQSL